MDYKIPLFKLNFTDEEEKAVVETIRSKWISTGPKNSELENRFCDMLQVKHALALSNCTVSLHLAMVVAGIKAGDEVICPSLTFVASANSIRYVNAVPVFADISGYDDLTISPTEIEKKITSKTKAILVVNYAGFTCDLSKVKAIAKKHNLKIIEDASHSPLAEFDGKKLGTIGDIGCFSFFSNKNISTGEGGMLVTNNTEMYEKAKLLRSHGMTSLSYERAKGHSTTYDVVELGYNFRMDDIRAALGIAQLNKLENDLQKRQKVREYYEKSLQHINGIIIPFSGYPYFSSNYIFPLVLKNSDFTKRDKIRQILADKGIQTSVHYPAVHRFSIYEDNSVKLPLTEYVSDNLITLPFYADLSNNEIDFIAENLKKALD